MHDANEALRGCFEATDGEVLTEPHSEEIDELTHCITGYINICVDNVIPTRTLQCLPNNKPWITRDIKALLNDKKRVFKAGDKGEIKKVQKTLRTKIKDGKDAYRRRMEYRLQHNNTRKVWNDMRRITGYNQTSSNMRSHLRPLVRPALDRLQFAYQECIGVEDAIIYLLH